jgi:hypothetical protein
MPEMPEHFCPPWMADMPKMQDAFFGPASPFTSRQHCAERRPTVDRALERSARRS